MTQIIEKLACVIGTYGVAYCHETVGDGLSRVNRTWAVYEIGDDDPFLREGQVWLGIFDNKADADRCAALANAKAALEYLRDNPGEAWDGLARQIIFWMDMEPKTPRTLFRHLEQSGHDIPQWLRDEPEMQALDHVPSKGTRAVIVFKAILNTALGEE